MLLDGLVAEVRKKEDEAAALAESMFGETPVDIVNEQEIYLVKRFTNNNGITKLERGRRICGHRRMVDGYWLRCRLAAGADTVHNGYGICKIHEKYAMGKFPASTLLTQYHAQGYALQIKDLYRIKGEILDNPAFWEIREEIMVVSFLLDKAMNDIYPDREHIMTLAETSARLKGMRRKMEVEKLELNVASIKLFVQGMFNILRKLLTPQMYSQVCFEFQQKLVFPVNQSMQAIIETETTSMEVTKKKLPGSTI